MELFKTQKPLTLKRLPLAWIGVHFFYFFLNQAHHFKSNHAKKTYLGNRGVSVVTIYKMILSCILSGQISIASWIFWIYIFFKSLCFAIPDCKIEGWISSWFGNIIKITLRQLMAKANVSPIWHPNQNLHRNDLDKLSP